MPIVPTVVWQACASAPERVAQHAERPSHPVPMPLLDPLHAKAAAASAASAAAMASFHELMQNAPIEMDRLT
jgi:hypothetical protein